MNEIIENLATYVGLAFGGYAILLVGASFIQNLASERIHTQEQLEKVVDEEADKLRIDKGNLVAKFYSVGDKKYDTIRGARCIIAGFDLETDTLVPAEEVDNEQIISIKLIEIKEGWGANGGAVRHELYHLSGHFPRKRGIIGVLRKWFYEEPTAVLYATTRIKL